MGLFNDRTHKKISILWSIFIFTRGIDEGVRTMKIWHIHIDLSLPDLPCPQVGIKNAFYNPLCLYRINKCRAFNGVTE